MLSLQYVTFRLTPVYAVIIFFFATLQYKMGSGPLWESFIGTDKQNCQKTWWISLLYLNNYVETDKTVSIQLNIGFVQLILNTIFYSTSVDFIHGSCLANSISQ